MKRVLIVFCLTTLILVLTIASQAGELSREEIEKRNKEIVRKAHASLAAGDFETFKSTIGPNYVRHCQAMPPGLQKLHGGRMFYQGRVRELRAS